MSRRYNDDDVQQLVIDYHRTGNLELRERIVEQFPNLVESIARRFVNTGEPIEDLVQEGYIGLLNAIDLYKPTGARSFPPTPHISSLVKSSITSVTEGRLSRYPHGFRSCIRN